MNKGIFELKCILVVNGVSSNGSTNMREDVYIYESIKSEVVGKWYCPLFHIFKINFRTKRAEWFFYIRSDKMHQIEA
jgi:hypothetical protein